MPKINKTKIDHSQIKSHPYSDHLDELALKAFSAGGNDLLELHRYYKSELIKIEDLYCHRQLIIGCKEAFRRNKTSFMPTVKLLKALNRIQSAQEQPFQRRTPWNAVTLAYELDLIDINSVRKTTHEGRARGYLLEDFEIWSNF